MISNELEKGRKGTQTQCRSYLNPKLTKKKCKKQGNDKGVMLQKLQTKQNKAMQNKTKKYLARQITCPLNPGGTQF